MSMTKERKRLMNRLRRKYQWKSDTNYGSGTTLIKADAATWLHKQIPEANDLSIYINDYDIRRQLMDKKHRNDITIRIHRYALNTKNNTWKAIETVYAFLSFDELELIYQIAKEKRNEIADEMKGET